MSSQQDPCKYPKLEQWQLRYLDRPSPRYQLLPQLRSRLPRLRLRFPNSLCPRCLRFRLHLLLFHNLYKRLPRLYQRQEQHLLRSLLLLTLLPLPPRPQSPFQRYRQRLQSLRLRLRYRQHQLRQQREQLLDNLPSRERIEVEDGEPETPLLYCDHCQADVPWTAQVIAFAEGGGFELHLCGFCERVLEKEALDED